MPLKVSQLLESFLTGILSRLQSAEEQYQDGIKALEGRESGWQDAKKAARLFKYSADRGNIPALIKLGECHEFGIGLSQNVDEAIKLYRLAASQGSAEALGLLGSFFRTGNGVEKDTDEALRLYRAASDQNDPAAQNAIGICTEEGIGVPQDNNKAANWYRRAAERGNADAQYNLGRCYSRGIGVPQDHQKAVQWYRRAVEHSIDCLDQKSRIQTSPCIAAAQFALAEAYDQGLGVERSKSEAAAWYKKASFRNHPEACRKYAIMLDEAMREENGESVD